MLHRFRTRTARPLTLLGALLLLAVAAPAAQAHIQISPTVAAPGDAVHFTLLIPGETGSGTTKVELKVPKDVIPFSFQDVPGWKRDVIEAADGSVDRIVWTGSLEPNGFVEFGILASTPETEGELKWAAVQTYADGTVAKWIGSAGSEEPAPVTEVTKAAALQNAGGESQEGSEGTAGTAAQVAQPVPSGVVAAPVKTTTQQVGHGDDNIARLLGGLGLALGAIALGISIASRRRHRA